MDLQIYTRYAKYYDVLYRDYLERSVPKLIDFTVKVFKEVARRDVRDVLDIACGTGGPTIELARRGYRVVGLDISRDMVRIARRKAVSAGVRAVFKVGDMRRIRFRRRFDAVTCFFTSINYNVSDDDMLSTMKGVFRALRDGGVFIADAPNPYRAERWLRGEPVVWRVDHDDVSILILDSVVMGRVSALIEWERTLVVKEGGRVTMIPDHHRLRAYSANELKLFAKLAGFSDVRVYGDFRIEDVEPRDARRLVLVATR